MDIWRRNMVGECNSEKLPLPWTRWRTIYRPPTPAYCGPCGSSLFKGICNRLEDKLLSQYSCQMRSIVFDMSSAFTLDSQLVTIWATTRQWKPCWWSWCHVLFNCLFKLGLGFYYSCVTPISRIGAHGILSFKTFFQQDYRNAHFGFHWIRNKYFHADV